jgi:hypothetical protein
MFLTLGPSATFPTLRGDSHEAQLWPSCRNQNSGSSASPTARNGRAPRGHKVAGKVAGNLGSPPCRDEPSPSPPHGQRSRRRRRRSRCVRHVARRRLAGRRDRCPGPRSAVVVRRTVLVVSLGSDEHLADATLGGGPGHSAGRLRALGARDRSGARPRWPGRATFAVPTSHRSVCDLRARAPRGPQNPGRQTQGAPPPSQALAPSA